MLDPEEKAFIDHIAQINTKFGLMSHAVALSRIINGLGGNQVTPVYLFNQMQVADLDVNERIRELKAVPNRDEDRG